VSRALPLCESLPTGQQVLERGIALKVLTQNIDTSTSEGRLFFHMTAAFDEFQRELIVENTRAGLAAANKRGRRGGRPKAMNEQTIKQAEALLKDTENYPFIGDVIDQLGIGRTAFYRYFPTDRIKELRHEHSAECLTGAKSCGGLRTFMQRNPLVVVHHPGSKYLGVWGKAPRQLIKSQMLKFLRKKYYPAACSPSYSCIGVFSRGRLTLTFLGNSFGYCFAISASSSTRGVKS
jgi:hypothetical protein